jgi:hypothetical protein
LAGCFGQKNAGKVVAPVPNRTVCAGFSDGCYISGRIVRVMTFQSSLMWMGMTG